MPAGRAVRDGRDASLLTPAILVAARSRCRVLAMLYYGARFDLGLSLDSYALMLVTAQRLARERRPWVAGGRQPRVERAAGRRTRRAPGPSSEITVRGPVTYAGPGSLGGTESALRRYDVDASRIPQ